jgi:hypothetical protein
VKRNEVQAAHEAAVLKSFVEFQASLGKEMKVVDTPDPPDAIVTIDKVETWIELTNAFLDAQLAESVTTYAADDKEHRGLSNGWLSVSEPDKNFSEILKRVIVKKYTKASIGKIFQKRGAGILLVGIQNPFSNAYELISSEKKKILGAIGPKESRFKEIFLFSSHDHDFYKLL